MRLLFTSLPMLAAPVAASADKYAVSESIAGNGAIPGWLLPVMFVALLVYHLRDHSKLEGQLARDRYQHEQTARMLAEAKASLRVAENDAASLRQKYQGLHAAVQQDFDGRTTDEEFTSAVDPYIEPIDYVIHKKPGA